MIRRPGSVSASRRRRTGSVVVEFALGAGVLLAAFAGVFQFGYAFLQYGKLQSAVAQGARLAAIIPYDSPTVTPSPAYRDAVRNMVRYGSPVAGASPLADLAAENIALTVTFTRGVPASVTVAVTGYAFDAVFGTITLEGKPRVTYLYQGVWAPI